MRKMDRIFKSKVDWWYHFFMWLIIAACVMVILGQNIAAIIFTFLVTMGVLYTFLNTYYVVKDENILILHCGIFPKKEIRISEIEALEPTIFPAFSYALSLDRIIIWKEGKMWMMASPQNEREFVHLLKKINPEIEIKKNEGLI